MQAIEEERMIFFDIILNNLEKQLRKANKEDEVLEVQYD